MGLALLCIAAAGASAQPPPVTNPEAIVVTGERVARRLKDTASSVHVTTARDIEAMNGADRVEEALALVPNVQLGSGGEGPTIRGQDTTGTLRDLGAFLGGNRPRTTMIIDGRAVTYNEFVFGAAPLWDVARIEVFRSPQTTTQGRNSIAGAIFVETDDPQFQWAGKARAIAGDLRTREISGMVTGPLGGSVAMRVSGDVRSSRSASVLTSNARDAPDPNADVYGLLRVKLLVEPAALPGARLLATYAHNEAHSPQIAGIRTPFQQRADPFATYGIFRTNVDSLTFRGSAPLGSDLSIESTLSAGDGNIRRYAPPGLGEAQIHGRDWSGEAIARWRRGEALKLLAGASASGTNLDQGIDLSAVGLGNGDFADVQGSVGLFGEGEWRPATRLKLTAGLRYERDRQTRSGALGSGTKPIVLAYRRAFSAWLPKVSLEYDLGKSVSVGAMVERAFNPGGTTINILTRQPDEFEAETLWDYELFARLSVPRSRLSASANLFYNAIENAQRPLNRSVVTPGGTANFVEIVNEPRAHSYGLEAELRWSPGERLSIGAGLGLLATRITRGSPPDPLLGKQFQRSPHMTASASIDWRPLRSFRLSAQVHHNSGYFSDDSESAAFRVGGSTVVNARASLDRGPATLFAYVRNIGNAFDLTYIFPTPVGPPTLATAVDPREFGAGIEARF